MGPGGASPTASTLVARRSGPAPAGVGAGRGGMGRGAVARGAPRVNSVSIGPYARVDGATPVEDSTLLSGEGEPAEILSGSCVTGALLQWGSRVATLAVVERSV